LEKDFFIKRKKIFDKYEFLIGQIDIKKCNNLKNEAEKELRLIINSIFLKIGTEIIFDKTIFTNFNNNYFRLKNIKFVKIMSVNMILEIENKNTQKFNINKLLYLLKNNKWHYSKNTERVKKIERLLYNNSSI
jgi:hypothetical protein